MSSCSSTSSGRPSAKCRRVPASNTTRRPSGSAVRGSLSATDENLRGEADRRPILALRSPAPLSVEQPIRERRDVSGVGLAQEAFTRHHPPEGAPLRFPAIVEQQTRGATKATEEMAEIG